MQSLEHLLQYDPRPELAKRHFLEFVKFVKPSYEENWHHTLLSDYLEKFISGEIKRLMVFMPPQHGKSELVSRNLPAYILGKNPKAKVVLASYSADLSSTFNRDCQRIMDTEEYGQVFPETTLTQKSVVNINGKWLRNADIFETVGHGGFLKTTGVGGALTGTPADFAIIDDPVKDTVEAMSATYQFRNWNWYNDVLYTRIHNNTGILITQTRWNENDLSGLLLKQMEEGTGEQWTIVSLPAIKENEDNPEDPREIGEALWPKKHDLAKLFQVRSQNNRTFQSLYQQKPQPVQAGGEFYKSFDMTKHVGVYPYDPTQPLHLTFDFNVNPYMTCCVWQVTGKTARQIAEICLKSPRNRTSSICAEVKSKYKGHATGLFIYGDPSGKKQDTRTEQGSNDFSIILKELSEFRPKERVARAAPSVVMRGEFINTIFESGYMGISIGFDSKCSYSTDDYMYLKEDSDGTKKKEKAIEPSTGISHEKWGHTSDANDYFLCEVFNNEYKKFQSRGQSNIANKLALFR